MNIKCSNCHSYKTRRKRTPLFFITRLFAVGLVFAIPPALDPQLRGILVITLTIMFLYAMYHVYQHPEAFSKYKCKTCGFEFVGSNEEENLFNTETEEEKIKDKDRDTKRLSAKVLINAEDLIIEGNRAGAVKLIKENTSLSIPEIHEFMREEGLLRLLPKEPSDRVVRLAKFLLKRYDLPLPAIQLIQKNTSLSLKESASFVDGLRNNDNKN